MFVFEPIMVKTANKAEANRITYVVTRLTYPFVIK
jgi:hypothetical protein